MYQLTNEDLAQENAGEGKKKWVNDSDFKNGEVVDFNVVDWCLVEKVDKDGVNRYHAQQKMIVLSGDWKGKEYTHTWWDVLAPNNADKPGRSLQFMTWALKNMGLRDDELKGALTVAVSNAIGRSFTAVCRQKPKSNGNGFYTSWQNHKPLN